MYISYFEILLYHLFTKEGYNVEFLVYDENILIHELITKEVDDLDGKDKFLKKNVTNAKKLHRNAKINYEYINAQRKEVFEEVENVGINLESIFHYKKDEIDFGYIIKGALYRYYKSLNVENKSLEVAKRFLHTALTNYYEIKENGKKQI